MPYPEQLAQAYDDISAEKDPKRIPELFSVLAERVREHSDEMKRCMYG